MGTLVRHFYLRWLLILAAIPVQSTHSLSFGLKMSSSEGIRVDLKQYKDLASKRTPFNNDEVSNVLKSLRNVTPPPSQSSSFNEEKLRSFLKERAHLNHKEWSTTGTSADSLKSILLPEGKTIETDEAFQTAFRRVLEEGNWKGAAEFSSSQDDAYKPWIVLVTGVNGIRKTTTIYEPWFPQVLREALNFAADDGSSPPIDAETVIPVGSNSFFRQLDHMIAVLANEDFARLYQLENLKEYAELKDGVFTRYRKAAESLGVLLLKEAQGRKMNAMVETSGRDIAMFRYIDHFFDDKDYNKLVIHFKVNDLSHAEKSVDLRMEKEMQDGKAAMVSNDPQKIIDANAGGEYAWLRVSKYHLSAREVCFKNHLPTYSFITAGPYGSEVLKGVQADSARVWESVISGDDAGKTWFKASIAIEAHDTMPWKAGAVAPDGTKGKSFTFTPRK